MSDDNILRHEGLTRRDYVTYGGAVFGGGFLAGCAGESSPENGDKTSDSGGKTYSVAMSPMGDVEFGAIPETVMAYATNYVDITVALGHGGTVSSVWGKETIGPTLEYFYNTLDGVSLDWRSLKTLTEPGSNTLSKEVFYELDSDVHFLDPCHLTSFKGWGNTDVQDIRENVGPFFGNYYSRKHTQPPERCRNDYRYYTLWELTEKYAELFQESKRYEKLHQINEELHDSIHKALPPKNQRPTVGMAYPRFSGSKPGFYVHHLNSPGYFWAHIRPLKPVDGFADIEMTDQYGGELVDYEAMLEADPEVILLNHGITPFYDVASVQKKIRNHAVGRKLSAVKSGRVYVSGNPRQGPIMNLFQVEMTAKQLYPEQFGEWPGYVNDEPYPEIPDGEQLFDRKRLAGIINGDDGS